MTPTAYPLLQALEITLQKCLDAADVEGDEFERDEWTWIDDCWESPPVRDEFAMLDPDVCRTDRERLRRLEALYEQARNVVTPGWQEREQARKDQKEQREREREQERLRKIAEQERLALAAESAASPLFADQV